MKAHEFVKRMIEKEEKHIEFLLKEKARVEKKFFRIFYKDFIKEIDKLILVNQAYLEYYRIKYYNYSSKDI